MQQWRLKNKIKDVLEECATSFTHLNEDVSGNILASRETKDCAENNPSFPDPISTPSPPCSVLLEADMYGFQKWTVLAHFLLGFNQRGVLVRNVREGGE